MSWRSSSQVLAATENRLVPRSPSAANEAPTTARSVAALVSSSLAGSIWTRGRRRRPARWVWSSLAGLFRKMGPPPASPFSWPRARQGDPPPKPYRPALPQSKPPPPAPGHEPRRLRRDRPDARRHPLRFDNLSLNDGDDVEAPIKAGEPIFERAQAIDMDIEPRSICLHTVLLRAEPINL